MSRIVKTESIAGERNRLMRLLALTLRELMRKKGLDGQAQDMVAFVILAPESIAETVEKSVLPWEKRDYWLKADSFRREWGWAASLATALRKAVASEPWDWEAIPPLLAQASERVSKVAIPVRNRLGEPWVGAWLRYQTAGSGKSRNGG